MVFSTGRMGGAPTPTPLPRTSRKFAHSPHVEILSPVDSPTKFLSPPPPTPKS